MKPAWAKGMREVSPGAYADGKGGLHFSIEELCEAAGVPPTKRNADALVDAARRIAARDGMRLNTDDLKEGPPR